jgi:hypothetical protein
MTIRTRLIAGLASLAIAISPVLRLPAAWSPPVLTGLVLTGTVATEAAARARGGRSSGGYSRPSVRTPSFSAPRTATPRYTPPRTPSTSGGYARPSQRAAPPPIRGGAQSSGDQALSRQRAADALRQQRTLEQQRQQAPRPSPAPSRAWGTGDRRTPSVAAPPPAGSSGWFAQRGWSAPPYAATAPRSFGVWDGLFLWFLLDNLNRPGYADWFRGNRNDPGVQQWRQQADAMARENPELRGKLAQLDARTDPATAPADTGWVEVPPDIPSEIATFDEDKRRTPTAAPAGGSSGFGMLFGFALVGGAGALAYMAVRRRRAEQGAAPMNKLESAAAMARNALSPQAYTPQHFRVGMVLTVDLSPFILAAGATKVTPPEGSTEGRATVAAVGQLSAAGMVRLHLADRRSLFQLHLGADGLPDECRYFSLFDEVTPADAAEWDAWLHPAEGMIGWPEFQTQDDKLYRRAWSPGSTKVPPLAMVEEIATAEGTDSVRLQSMLYAAPTGLPAPAPPTEYILVSVVERQGHAWVELRAGIDINPATLELT